jgi:hypothetical protein
MAEEKTTDNLEKILSELNTVEDRKQALIADGDPPLEAILPVAGFLSGTGFCGTAGEGSSGRGPRRAGSMRGVRKPCRKS